MAWSEACWQADEPVHADVLLNRSHLLGLLVCCRDLVR